jgi:hypothetical protein
MEFDLDPYLGGGAAQIFFDFRPVGGGTSLQTVPFISGPDIRVHIHQADVGGETGGFFKYFANLTTDFTPAWGVSVTENPDPAPFPPPGGNVVIVGGGGGQIDFPWNPPYDYPGWKLSRDPSGQLVFMPVVPEPSTVLLGVAAAGLLIVTRRLG